MFLNQAMQAVVILACERHAPAILEKLNDGSQGNWFVMPPTSTFLMGYWPNVCTSHGGEGCAIFGFIERELMMQKLNEFNSAHMDDGVCPDCAIYDWPIVPLHAARTTRDPVCKQVVNCDNSLSENYHHRLFFFCSPNCRDRFHLAPHKFVDVPAPEPVPPRTKTLSR